MKIPTLTFEGGLIDDLCEVRSTVMTQGRGCRRASNVICLPQGPAMTRPSERYMGSTKGHAAARLIRVVYSEVYAYEVEFGVEYCRFWSDDGAIMDGGDPYEIVSPYTADELFDLQIYNDAGTLYIVHPDHPPYRLVYAGEAEWTLEPIPFEWGPFLDINDTDVTLTVTVPDPEFPDDVIVTASDDIFAAGQEGALLLIGHRTGEQTLSETFTGDDASDTPLSVGKGATWSLTVTGTWEGTLALQKSYDEGDTWEQVKLYTANTTDDVGDETWDEALYRWQMTGWTSGTSCKPVLTVAPYIHYGYIEITGEIVDPSYCQGEMQEDVWSDDATIIWAWGAWGGERHYPRSVGLVDNRLTFGSTEELPTTLWQTRTNLYADMRTGTDPADALIWTFTTGKGDPFLWILGDQETFYVGTPSAVLEMAAADPTAAISPTNKPAIRRRIDFGSGTIQPVRAHGTIIFMDPEYLRPMHKQYDWEQDLMLSPSLAHECPTVTEPGIKQIAFQRGRVPIVWFLRTDGILLGMTFEQRFRENIIGWHVHETYGEIESIDVAPGTGGDRLWWVVAREVDGDTERHIGRLDAIELTPTRTASKMLDGYVAYEGVAAQDIEDLSVDPDTGVVTVTITDHGLTDGDQVDFDDVGGATWLNGQVLTVADDEDDTFTLTTADGDYVDGRLIGTYTTGGTVRQVENEFAGLDHLEGLPVYLLADGRVLGPYTVADGEIATVKSYNTVYAGLAPEWEIEPLRLVAFTQAGASYGRQQHLTGLWISVYRSWECQAGPDADHMQLLRFGSTLDALNDAPDLVTTDKYVHVAGGYTDDPTILLQGQGPLPFCVRAMMLDTGMAGMKAT